MSTLKFQSLKLQPHCGYADTDLTERKQTQSQEDKNRVADGSYELGLKNQTLEIGNMD